MKVEGSKLKFVFIMLEAGRRRYQSRDGPHLQYHPPLESLRDDLSRPSFRFLLVSDVLRTIALRVFDLRKLFDSSRSSGQSLASRSSLRSHWH